MLESLRVSRRRQISGLMPRNTARSCRITGSELPFFPISQAYYCAARTPKKWIHSSFHRFSLCDLVKHVRSRPQGVASRRPARVERHLQDRLDNLLEGCTDIQAGLNVRAQLRYGEAQRRTCGDQQELACHQIKARPTHDTGQCPLNCHSREIRADVFEGGHQLLTRVPTV